MSHEAKSKERLTCHFAVTLFFRQTKIKSFLIVFFCLMFSSYGVDRLGGWLSLGDAGPAVICISLRTYCSHTRTLLKCDRWIDSAGMTSDSCYSHSPASYSSQSFGIRTSLGPSGSSAAGPGTWRPDGSGLRPG